ncbi:hypothetical protein [Bradyrhizobium sp. 2TAF24]|uniref:terminase small subunit-like protein n=1 Tax=Bradyrhizobium sp. 2TAF24 TaxID=3233011 RepID=UPI003F8F560F
MKDPSRYRQTILDRISFGISRGRTLESLCGVDGMPSLATLRRWARLDPDGFGAAFQRGRAFDLQARLDALLEIADDSRDDWRPRAAPGDAAPAAFDRDNVTRARLRIRAHGADLARAMAKADDLSADRLTGVLDVIAARAAPEG